ncbi:GAP family protein [Arthrobacter sp. L77]|uniref:GAP family protein n=1 Tax=Arthrobacter sp. L77 TaxID=1496689 RepID=UPI0009E19880|nr:GAP family protein [Arthrobacter sp. L77]
MAESPVHQMIGGGLLVGIVGLALADSLNPATIVVITLILLTVRHRPVGSAVTFVLGAMSTVFVLGTAIFLGASAAADAVGEGLIWLRRTVFLIAAITLAVAGFRRFKDRERKGVELPRWFGVWTAFPLGILITGADLPNAFPYFIAIERMVAADVDVPVGLSVLAGYALVYCIPCLVLLAFGLAHGDKVRTRLRSVLDRFSTGIIERSVPAALILFALAAAVLTLALWP